MKIHTPNRRDHKLPFLAAIVLAFTCCCIACEFCDFNEGPGCADNCFGDRCYSPMRYFPACEATTDTLKCAYQFWPPGHPLAGQPETEVWVCTDGFGHQCGYTVWPCASDDGCMGG